jgi:tetratricopeptide (TPR) repeat protein
MLGLADALMGIGDVAAARRVAQAALSISLERNVPPNQRVAEAQETVALVLLKLGETSEATELLSSALELNKNAVGMAHVRYARSLARLAMSHFESHDIAGAARRLTESFDISPNSVSLNTQQPSRREFYGRELQLQVGLPPLQLTS